MKGCARLPRLMRSCSFGVFNLGNARELRESREEEEEEEEAADRDLHLLKALWSARWS